MICDENKRMSKIEKNVQKNREKTQSTFAKCAVKLHGQIFFYCSDRDSRLCSAVGTMGAIASLPLVFERNIIYADYRIKTSSFKINWIFPPDFHTFLRSCLKILGHGYKKNITKLLSDWQRRGFHSYQITDYGHPVFSKIPDFWAWADKLGQNFGGAFGVFSADLSVPILVLRTVSPLSICFH